MYRFCWKRSIRIPNITFTEAPNSPIAVGTSPVAIATGDLNADGVGDLAVVNQGDNTLSILLGSTTIDGTFTVAPRFAVADGDHTSRGAVIASFANGPSPDIAVTNQDQSTLSVFLGLGGGTFQTGVELNTPASPGALIVSQLTSSGLPDVALVAQGPTTGQGLVTDYSRFGGSGSGGKRLGTDALSRGGIYGYRFEDKGHAGVASQQRSDAATGI